MERYDFNRLDEAWPSDLVARSQVEKFTGGLFKAGTLANLDSKGVGPDQRLRVGSKIVYPKQALIRWLMARSTHISNKE